MQALEKFFLGCREGLSHDFFMIPTRFAASAPHPFYRVLHFLCELVQDSCGYRLKRDYALYALASVLVIVTFGHGWLIPLDFRM